MGAVAVRYSQVVPCSARIVVDLQVPVHSALVGAGGGVPVAQLPDPLVGVSACAHVVRLAHTAVGVGVRSVFAGVGAGVPVARPVSLGVFVLGPVHLTGVVVGLRVRCAPVVVVVVVPVRWGA